MGRTAIEAKPPRRRFVIGRRSVLGGFAAVLITAGAILLSGGLNASAEDLTTASGVISVSTVAASADPPFPDVLNPASTARCTAVLVGEPGCAEGGAASPAAPTSAKERLPANTLSVPSMGIQALIVPGGVDEGNSMILPVSSEVAMLTDGAPLGAISGTTLLAGHVNFADGSDGALAPLITSKPGELVSVSDAAGLVHAFRIVSVDVYMKQALPEDLFQRTGERRLALVTCFAQVDDGVLTYPKNTVVTAVPVV